MTPPALLTRSAAPLRLRTPPGLLPDARHVVLPEGIASSGAPAIIGTCETLGIQLDPWQRDACTAILAKDASSWYAADTVVLSIPRQVGKTFLIGAITFADSIANPGTLTVWTAHRFKVSRESFDELRALAELDSMAPHVDREAITTAAGNEVIPFRNGSRIVFAARERGSIRGFRKVRRLVLDEAQILPDAALSDLAPTQNQAHNPQIILMGTPPKPSDAGAAFTRLRDEALSGEAGNVTYLEYGAEPGSDLDDRDAWRTANPSYPVRTPERSMLRLRRLLTDEDFLREGLGIWAELDNVGFIPSGDWLACRDLLHEPGERVSYGLDVDVNAAGTEWCSIGASDGTHVEVVTPPEVGPGLGWVVAAVVAKRDRFSELVIDPSGPAGKLIGPLEQAGVPLRKVKPAEFVQACGQIADAVEQRTVKHLDQHSLNRAVVGAARRDVGDGAWKLSRARSKVDISPFVAVTLARFLAVTDNGEGDDFLW